MSKRAVSLTLDESNILWLRGRERGRGNLSAAVDELITAARTAGVRGHAAARTVIGTIDLAADDPRLDRADAAVRELFAQSLSRPLQAAEAPPSYAATTRPRRSRRRG
jgi:hypothetical protein